MLSSFDISEIDYRIGVNMPARCSFHLLIALTSVHFWERCIRATNKTRWPVDGMLRRWGRRLPKLQRNVRSAPNFSDAAMGSIAHRTKVLAEGGCDKISSQAFKNVSVRRQKFTREICHGETFSVTRFAITGERIAVVSLRIYLALHHLKGFVSTMFLKGDGNKAEEFRKRKKKELNAVEHVVREEKTVGGYELSGIYSVLYGCAAYIWAAIFSPLIVVKFYMYFVSILSSYGLKSQLLAISSTSSVALSYPLASFSGTGPANPLAIQCDEKLRHPLGCESIQLWG
ncbi:hypothetical protein Bca52824_007706 [Brassica carinata]|uniref:Uncharacterized protein n=1 Tax=Brassica carinata TaxID=52824 RepID=A0A8X7W6P9_BRACI|nr:hypothetical protein Bca52824_007706 [Brassica carinata]